MKRTVIKILLFTGLWSTHIIGFAQTNLTTLNKEIMGKVENLRSLHDSAKSLSVVPLFKGVEGTTRSLQIKKDGLLPEHLTKTEALLICVNGEVAYEDEKGEKHLLRSEEFYHIMPNIKHWIKGVQDSQLLLIK